MFSAICSSLDHFEILSSGNGLNSEDEATKDI